MAQDYDLFVIGGGSAGVRCARIAAGHGARVAIAEQRFWGGTCVNVGCVPKKIMVQAAEYGLWAADAPAFGWEATAPKHDWAALARARDAEVSRLSAIYRRLLAGANATVFDARATLAGPGEVEVNGERIRAQHILIATGGTPARLPIPGAEHGLVSDDLFTLPAAPKRAVVLGGGYIALEFACILKGLGAEVEVVHRAPLPLRGFDEDIRAALAEALSAQGIVLTPDASPTRIARTDAGLMLTLSSGHVREADAVFFATGRVPNTQGLGLDAAGVMTDARGAIRVDADHRTNVCGIYALGDVIDRVNLTPMATATAHALADTLFGGRPRRASYANVPTAVFTSPPVATVGLTEAQAAEQGPAEIYVTRFTPLRHTITGRAGRRTLMKLVVCARTRRVLGAHMLGEDAPEILQGIAVAIVAGATKEDFDRTIGIHPTAAEEFVTLRTPVRTAG
jgi:glutathione reductase (NADPH)